MSSKAELNLGCDDFPNRPFVTNRPYGGGHDARKASNAAGAKNNHSTVKPVDLMAYLVRLVTPKGGLVLDPFCGSGSTGMGCVQEGMKFVGIELDASYSEIARLRIAAWQASDNP